jgi:hypothetical protein
MGPILPVVGANTRFQPVYVDDVAQAAVKGVLGQAAPGVYELGGPEVDSFRGLMGRMLAVIQRRRAVVNVPFWVANIMGFAFDALQAVTLGLIENKMITATRFGTCGVTMSSLPTQRDLPTLASSPPRWRRFCRITCGASAPLASMPRSRLRLNV